MNEQEEKNLSRGQDAIKEMTEPADWNDFPPGGVHASPEFRKEMSNENEPLKLREGDIDEAVSRCYRRFKKWSKRGFTADDVTWCEVRADLVLIAEDLIREAAPPQPASQSANEPDEWLTEDEYANARDAWIEGGTIQPCTPFLNAEINAKYGPPSEYTGKAAEEQMKFLDQALTDACNDRDECIDALEQQLAAVKTQLEQMDDERISWKTEAEQRGKALAAARAEAALMKWMIDNYGLWDGNLLTWWPTGDELVVHRISGGNLRRAIKKAMEKSK